MSELTQAMIIITNLRNAQLFYCWNYSDFKFYQKLG